jgi:hypothetical protein
VSELFTDEMTSVSLSFSGGPWDYQEQAAASERTSECALPLETTEDHDYCVAGQRHIMNYFHEHGQRCNKVLAVASRLDELVVKC